MGRREKAGLLFHVRYSGKLKTAIGSKLRPETMKLPGESKTETLQNIAEGKGFFFFLQDSQSTGKKSKSRKWSALTEISQQKKQSETAYNRVNWNYILRILGEYEGNIKTTQEHPRKTAQL